MLDLLYSNFARPPDAWWKRARGILEHGDLQATILRDSAEGAGWIRKAVRVQDALRTTSPEQLMRDYRGIVLARHIYEEIGPDAQLSRWAIEARILAKQSDAEISRAQGCPRDVIAAYGALFFNVRDRLQFPDYIWCGLLGRQFTDVTAAWDLGMIWKAFAYAGGPYVLEDLISQTLDGKWVPSAEGIASFLRDQPIATIQQKAAVAALSIPVESRTMLALIDHFISYMRLARDRESNTAAPNQIEENLEALLKGLASLTSR